MSRKRRSQRIKKKITVLTLGALLLRLVLPPRRSSRTKVPRIGYLVFASLSAIAARIEAFRQGLRELGYVEGKNIVIEYRYARENSIATCACGRASASQGRRHRHGWSGSNPCRQGSNDHDSHCHGADSDPVGNGFVASLARPGGNITGLSTLAPELSGKQLELLKEIVPRLSRVAVFGTSTNPGNAQALKEVELAAKAFGVKLQYLDVLSPKDIETAFRAANKGRAEAVLMMVAGAVAHFSPNTDCRTRGKEPTPGDIHQKSNMWKPGGS